VFSCRRRHSGGPATKKDFNLAALDRADPSIVIYGIAAGKGNQCHTGYLLESARDPHGEGDPARARSRGLPTDVCRVGESISLLIERAQGISIARQFIRELVMLGVELTIEAVPFQLAAAAVVVARRIQHHSLPSHPFHHLYELVYVERISALSGIYNILM